MTSIESTRATWPGGRYGTTVLKASTAGGVAGFAFGLWREGLPDSPWMAVGATGAALLAAYWTHQAMLVRKPSVAPAVATVRAAVAALPVWTRRLALPAPANWTAERPRASQKAKPAAAKRAAENQAAPNSERRGSAEDERARLKADGFNDAEISAILVARATGAATAKGGFGTGAAAGAFLNNLDAVLAYARNLVPSFKSDLERIFDESAGKADRTAGTLSFALKVLALAVIGYFLWLEAIEFRARALDMWAKACISRQENAIRHASPRELMSSRKLDGDDDCKSK